MATARVSDSFALQLLKAQETLSAFLNRKVTIPEITEKIILKVHVINKAFRMADINVPAWDTAPIIIVCQGVRRYRNKKVTLDTTALLSQSNCINMSKPQLQKLK